MTPPATLRWTNGPDGQLVLLDQTQLPGSVVEFVCRDVDAVWQAIRTLQVRGAPAIGIAAAYGVNLGLQQPRPRDVPELRRRAKQTAQYLATSRPTAVNLFWALSRMQRCADQLPDDAEIAAARSTMLAEAKAIHDEDRAMCRAIGNHGAALLADGQGVLTHCNAGGLATSEYGTALAVFFSAQDQGKRLNVFVDETRPLLQGARLTTWELLQRGISTTLICDSMAAQVMREGRIQAVVTGADRIAANGDVANKIGTYCLAVLAGAHHIPFYVAAPSSTFDLSLSGGEQIPIEQRAAEEVTRGFGKLTAPAEVQVYNPAFDVTPAALITALITEHGVIQPVCEDGIRAMLGS